MVLDRPAQALHRRGVHVVDLHLDALRGLARINWASRTAGALWPFVRRLAPGRLLDIACGGGDGEVAGVQSLRRPQAVRGELIAVLGVGRRDSADSLNSEEVDTLIGRLGDGARPPLTDHPLSFEVREVLERREPSYKAVADLTLPPGGTVAERAAAIETWLQKTHWSAQPAWGRKMGIINGRCFGSFFMFGTANMIGTKSHFPIEDRPARAGLEDLRLRRIKV